MNQEFNSSEPGPGLIDRARLFANKKHQGQLRSDNRTPYITHPTKVAALLMTLGATQELVAAAFLHDTLEDTTTTFEELKTEFGAYIALLVVEVTKDEHGQFSNLHSKDAIVLKFADRLSNLADMQGWSDQEQQNYLDKSKFW